MSLDVLQRKRRISLICKIDYDILIWFSAMTKSMVNQFSKNMPCAYGLNFICFEARGQSVPGGRSRTPSPYAVYGYYFSIKYTHLIFFVLSEKAFLLFDQKGNLCKIEIFPINNHVFLHSENSSFSYLLSSSKILLIFVKFSGSYLDKTAPNSVKCSEKLIDKFVTDVSMKGVHPPSFEEVKAPWNLYLKIEILSIYG